MPIFFQITPRNLPITIESIGTDWAQENIVRRDGYPHYHWLQTKSGIGKIEIDGEGIVLKAGEGILISPFIPHSYYSNDSWLTTFVTFAGTLNDSLQKIVGGNKYILNKDSDGFSFSGWINLRIEEHLAGSLKGREGAAACFEFLLNLSEVEEHLSEYEADPLFKKYIEPLLWKLEHSYKEPLSLEELAGEFYVSPQYLARLFKRYTGETIFTRLKMIRLNKSKELLINQPMLKISEVAFLCGFSDTSYYVSSFKEVAACTPLQFRKLYL